MRTRLSSLIQFGRATAFVMLTSAIVVVGSEKMFWYTGGYTPGAMIELTLFYSLAVMALLYVMARYSIATPAGLLLAAGVFAMVTEGIITPVVYEDGPLPVLFLYFLGWHGLIGVFFLWHTVRRWALAKRRLSLAVWSGGLGVAWGVWSTNYWRAETIAEQAAENLDGENWDIGQWAVPKFAAFAFAVSALLVACHWAIGFVWPTEWSPSRGWTLAVGAVSIGMLGLWTVALPWAPFKFAAIVWFLTRLMRRSHPSASSVNWFNAGAGHVQLVNLAPLAAMPSGAVGSYALMTAFDFNDPVLGAIYWTLVGATLVAGTVAMGWAIRATRTKSAEYFSPPEDCDADFRFVA